MRASRAERDRELLERRRRNVRCQPRIPWFERYAPSPTTGEPFRIRSEENRSRFRYVRKVKGDLWQARPWIGYAYGGSLNLGLYRSERAAGDAVREFLGRCRGGLDPLTVWTTVTKVLIAAGIVPAHVLPQGVVRVAGGYGAKFAAGQVMGPYPDPETACRVRWSEG